MGSAVGLSPFLDSTISCGGSIGQARPPKQYQTQSNQVLALVTFLLKPSLMKEAKEDQVAVATSWIYIRVISTQPTCLESIVQKTIPNGILGWIP